jgi:uncharacterized protein with PQ loop repeat
MGAMDNTWLSRIGLVASLILPLFNIPLMLRILKRRSADDLSLVWVLGVYACILLMEPAAWISPDSLFKFFATANLILFSGVVVLVLYFRLKKRC